MYLIKKIKIAKISKFVIVKCIFAAWFGLVWTFFKFPSEGDGAERIDGDGWGGNGWGGLEVGLGPKYSAAAAPLRGLPPSPPSTTEVGSRATKKAQSGKIIKLTKLHPDQSHT